MKYYKIMFDDENCKKKDIICFSEENYQEKYRVKQYDLNKGTYLNSWNNNFRFYYNSKQGYIPTDLLGNNLGWLIISQKFQLILKNIGIQNVQYLPIRIVNISTNEILEGFSVINVVCLTDAINLANSLYTEIEVSGIKVLSAIKYALNEKKLNGLHIVRLQNSRFATFISETVKNELERNKITGCDYLEVKII